MFNLFLDFSIFIVCKQYSLCFIQVIVRLKALQARGLMNSVAPVPVVSSRDAPRVQRDLRRYSSRRLVQPVLRFVGRLASQSQWRVFGHYSVSKLDSLNEFQRASTRAHIASYILLSALPSLVINIALEAIPLASPALGWDHSGAFLVRFFFTMLLTSMPPIATQSEYIPEFPPMTWRGVLLNGLLQSIVGVSVCMAVIFLTGIYPFPLTQFVPTIPMVIVGYLSAFRPIDSNSRVIQERQQRVGKMMWIEQLPVFMYPVFAALFMVSSPTVQMCLSATLPVLKLVIRSALARAGCQNIDILGVLTCASGHLYHILFVATCLQNSKSLKTIALIAAFSCLQMVFNAYDIVKSSARIRRRWTEVRECNNNQTDCFHIATGGLIATALKLASEESVGRSLHIDTPNIFLSTQMRYRRPEFLECHRAILVTTSELVETHQTRQVSLPTRISRRSHFVTATLRKMSRQPKVWLVQRRDRARMIAPAPTERQHMVVLTRSQRARKAFVVEVCATLHQTEMILLRSYITVSMLLFYAMYLVVVFWLPNRTYYLTMRFMTTIDAVGETVFRVLTLCALECVFVAVYLALLRRRLGISGLTQLAFILSSQRALFQAKCIAFPIVILGFPLEHFGNGIILHFAHDHP